MRRFVLSLLALLLLAFAGAAAADGDGDRDEGRDRDDDGRRDDKSGKADKQDDATEEDEGGRERERDEDEDDERDGDDGRAERKDGKQGHGGDKGKDGENRRDKGGDQPRQPTEQQAEPAPQPATIELTGDVSVRHTARVEAGRLSYVLAVGDVGVGTAEDVRLAAELPDLGGSWKVTGHGADDCAVEETLLSCSFGDLGAGELRLLRVASDVEEAPAWQVQSTATLVAGNDGDPANDAATSVVGVLLT
jgi:hypothetical protein